MSKLKSIIWYEHHRPSELEEMILSRPHRKTFNSFIKNKSIPHLLLHGPPGSGKTTLGMILVKYCSSASLTLNASSTDRGIGIIKTRVKQFAMSLTPDKSKRNIILVDEADGLTYDAQFALRNTIEAYHKNCRFIFTANEFDKIIDPIKSRCMIILLEKFPKKDLIKYMINILEEEEVEYKERHLEKLIEYFSHDIRTIINNLQAGSIDGKFKIKNIISLTDTEQLFKSTLAGNIPRIREQIIEQTDFTWIYKQLFTKFIKMVDNEYRGDIAITVAEYLWRDRLVADKQINLIACLLEIMQTLNIDIKF